MGASGELPAVCRKWATPSLAQRVRGQLSGLDREAGATPPRKKPEAKGIATRAGALLAPSVALLGDFRSLVAYPAHAARIPWVSMAETVTLRTERLLLRPWSSEDRGPFAALNADPTVMEWFPSTLTANESDALADRIEGMLADQGWGLWAVEVVGYAPFIGFIGLNRADAILGYPAVEAGWRLAAAHWGHGYATEGARAALRFGFDSLGLEAIVAFTASGNVRSRRVMTKVGMVHGPDEDFDHPRLPPTSPLVRHVLYRITRDSSPAPQPGLDRV